ncbi:hypothetical protein BA953_17140 [Vibrio coralliilyticus]|uniref:hypothetical protein n=1 Tax=Vibrio coralliilyticus TaxID=190893 RepID=UPI000810EBB2|nr:hypothetical protein [Vibrio coralliilyticus]ANW25915.1 hypothetical protein BA953_17140 [Vibrio coralliilyticus]
MTNHNPLLPRPIPVQYPAQYAGMEKELLERKLVIHDGHWYQAKPKEDGGYDAVPISPESQIMEFEARREGSSLKLVTPLPVHISSWAGIRHNLRSDKYYMMFIWAQKYNFSIDGFVVTHINSEPTVETFGHSLQALQSYERARAHWVEAGKEKEFLKFAEEKCIPDNWRV